MSASPVFKVSARVVASVMRSIPDATTRALTLKTGEADIAYVLDGNAAEGIKDDPADAL